jgi:hypothetical protein
MYIGILVSDGRMPGARRIDVRKVWDIRQLDVFFDALPSDDVGQRTWSKP